MAQRSRQPVRNAYLRECGYLSRDAAGSAPVVALDDVLVSRVSGWGWPCCCGAAAASSRVSSHPATCKPDRKTASPRKMISIINLLLTAAPPPDPLRSGASRSCSTSSRGRINPQPKPRRPYPPLSRPAASIDRAERPSTSNADPPQLDFRVRSHSNHSAGPRAATKEPPHSQDSHPPRVVAGRAY